MPWPSPESPLPWGAAGWLILPGPDDQAPSLIDEPTWRAVVVRSVLYLILITPFSLGIATAVRCSATDIGVVLGLLHVVPTVSQNTNDPQ